MALVLATMGQSAPLDQYFGRMQMSAVRIRYALMQLRPRYEKHELLPEQALHLATLSEDAYYAWAKAYPKDGWLASTGYLMAGLFAELPGSDARARAVRAYTFVKTQFPNTSYGKSSAAALHRGVAVKADPAWAPAMRAKMLATPSPSPAPLPAASTSPMPSGSAVPSPAASPAPLGSVSPLP